MVGDDAIALARQSGNGVVHAVEQRVPVFTGAMRVPSTSSHRGRSR